LNNIVIMRALFSWVNFAHLVGKTDSVIGVFQLYSNEIYMYIYMDECMCIICMYVSMYVCMYVSMYVCMYACMNVYIYCECMYASMYEDVCMNIYI
jgi:hypothetical protein